MCKVCEDRERLLEAMRRSTADIPFEASKPDWRKRFNRNLEVADSIIGTIQSDKENDFLSLSQDIDGKVSYAKCYEDRLNNSRRIKTTLGRYVRRRLAVDIQKLPDKILVAWQQSIFAKVVDASHDITIINGEAITEAYKEAFGGGSCMTGNCSNLVELYAANPDKVSLVMYRNGIDARALLWQTDQKTIVLDRIYPNSGQHIDALRTWAVAQGYVYRVSNSLPNGTVGLSDNKFYSVTVERTDELPYMDTFCYAEDLGDELVLTNNSNSAELTLQGTNGDALEEEENDEDHFQCENCNDQYHIENVYCDNNIYYCEDCYNELYFYCEDCSEDYPRGDQEVLIDGNKIVCQDCSTNYSYCDSCGYVSDGTTIVKDLDESYCDNCLSNVATQCEECNEYYFNEKIIENEDNESLCEDCYQESKQTKIDFAQSA